MGIVSVNQIAAGRSGSESADALQYVVKYIVKCDSGSGAASNTLPGGKAICNAAGLPPLGTAYSGFESASEPLATLKNKKAEPVNDSWNVWQVTCTFDTNQSQDDTVNAIFWVETEFVQKPVWKTWNHQDITNSAGQLFVGLQKIEAVETWVWERLYTSINRKRWIELQNTINQVDYSVSSGLPKHFGLLHVIVPKPERVNGAWGWRVQFRVKVSQEEYGWDLKPIDRGTLRKSVVNPNKREQIIDENLKQLDGQQLLDGQGNWSKDGTIVKLPVGSGAFQIYKEDAWADLNLGL